MNRKSMIATGAALVLLLGGAAGAYYYIDNKQDTKEAKAKKEADSLKLFSFDSNSVKGIDIKSSDGYYNLTFGDDGDWILEDTDNPYDFTVNSYYFNVVAVSMSSLTADHKADTKNGDLSKYGLDDPTTVICHTSDADYTLLVGSSSVTNEFCYVKLPDDDTVYCINYDTGKQLQGSISDIRSPYMLNCDDNRIKEFSLVHNGEVSYDVIRVNNGSTIWSLAEPLEDITVDAITVNTILTNMVRIQSSNFECFTKDEAELAEHGLDKPAYTFTVTTNEKVITLEFQEFAQDAEEVWCYDPDSCAVFSITNSNAAFLSGKWSDLAAKQAMSVPFVSTASLEMTVDGETHTLSIDQDNRIYKFDDTEIPAQDNPEAAKDFEYLYASVSEISHEDFRDDVPEKMGEPTCTFTYKLTDGTTRELALVPIDNETYWAYTDGTCRGMTVNNSAITGSNGCLSFIERLTADLAGTGAEG